MLGVEERRRQVAARKEADYEAYSRFEYEKLLLDELTDQSERLARPMENGFSYELSQDGKLYTEQGDSLEGVFDGGLVEAQRLASEDPVNWGFEYERRKIEREEIDEIQNLQDGEKIVVFSSLPDAVREGRTNISGYNRDRQKMLVRIAERQDSQVGIFSFSLDGSHYQAMQAAAGAIGKEIPDGMGSEEILANRFHFGAEHDFSLQDVHGLVRAGYDLEMERQFGGKFYAGRREITERDALSFIKSQPDLISEHMQAVQDIMARVLDKNEQKQLLENARYNFAAGLDKRTRGEDFDSLIDAGDSAAADGLAFDGDCATGSSSAAEQAGALGYNRGKSEKKSMTCPYCGLKTYSDVCAPVCDKCGSTPGNDKTKNGKIPEAENNSQPEESVLDMIERFNEEAKEKQRAAED